MFQCKLSFVRFIFHWLLFFPIIRRTTVLPFTGYYSSRLSDVLLFYLSLVTILPEYPTYYCFTFHWLLFFPSIRRTSVLPFAGYYSSRVSDVLLFYLSQVTILPEYPTYYCFAFHWLLFFPIIRRTTVLPFTGYYSSRLSDVLLFYLSLVTILPDCPTYYCFAFHWLLFSPIVRRTTVLPFNSFKWSYGVCTDLKNTLCDCWSLITVILCCTLLLLLNTDNCDINYTDELRFSTRHNYGLTVQGFVFSLMLTRGVIESKCYIIETAYHIYHSHTTVKIISFTNMYTSAL